jgi:coiled-coil domain-containing protein 12
LVTYIQNNLTLAPKKPNWDLKRDVAKKLEKLEKKTQSAILALIKEKQLEVQTTSAQMLD